MRLFSSFWVAMAITVAPAQVIVQQKTNSVAITIDGGGPETFFYGPQITKPFLFPLRSAHDTIVLRRWPMDVNADEPRDHIHHRGVWFAHADVNGIDFWNSDPSYQRHNMGKIVLTRIGPLSGGKRAGSIEAELAWLDPQGKELVHELRKMTFHSGDPRLTDFDIRITAREKVTFGDEKDGVFGLRLTGALDEPAAHGTGIMTASNGCRMESECWGERADWLDVSGKIGEEAVGVAVFDHPMNPRHPTYWHSRGYGLLAANIFGVKAFTHDPNADGAMTLARDESLHFRYRVVVHAGDAKSLPLNRLYERWAADEN